MSAAGPPKYDPLRRQLAGQPGDRVRLTFAEIEAILGVPLPPSAWTRDWWTNVGVERAQARAWLAAGWRRAALDVREGWVVFERREGPS